MASILLLNHETGDSPSLIVLLHRDVDLEAGDLVTKAGVCLGIPGYQAGRGVLQGGPQPRPAHGHQVHSVVEGLDSQHVLVGDVANVEVGSDPTIVGE